MSYRDRDDENDPDDELIEDEDEEENDEDSEDEQLARRSRLPTSNPFTSSSSSFGSSRPPGDAGRSNLPGRPYGSSSNLPGSPGVNRPGTPSSPSSPSTARPTYGGSSPTSPSSPGSPRPTYGGGSPTSPSSPSSPGSPRPTYGGSSPTSPSSPGATRPTYGGSSASSPSSPSSPSTSRPTYGSSSPSSPTSGSSSSLRSPVPSGAGDSSRNKDSDKDDDKGKGLGGLGKGLGGLTSRFGGGDKSEKPATPKSSSGGSNPLSNVTKGLGGITSRFGGGDKSQKPATPKSGSGGPLAGVTKGLGGLTSRIGLGKKDDKSAPKSSTASSYGASSSSSASRPPLGSRSGLSSGGSSAGTKAAPRMSFAERIKTSLPFLGAKDTKKTPSIREKAERASKAPRVDQTGLSLDNKLDILGVVLLLGSLALFFSSMSATKGQLTEAVNTFLAQLLGWGAIAVPVTMFAIGLWLIIRHFGDQAPVIQPTRIIGLAILYTGMLILFQYGESFNDLYRGIDPSNITDLQLQLEISYTLGRGGGWLGSQLYLLLVTNITEYGMVVSVIGAIFIGAMLLLRISAAEIAVFLISIGRSFFAARQRRVQARQAAARLAAAQAAAVAAQQISVSKPNAGEIAAPKSPALPATAAAEALPAATLPLPEPRPIPITMGGKTVTAFFDNNESVPVETPPAPAAQPAAAKSSFASRLMGAVPSIGLPGSKTAEAAPKTQPEAPKPAAEKEKSSGLLSGRLFNRPGAPPAEKGTASAANPASVIGKPTPSTPTAPAPAAPAPTAQSGTGSVLPPAASRPASPPPSFAKPASAASAPLFKMDGDTKPEDAPPVRLGELMKPTPPTAAAVPPSPPLSSASPMSPAPTSPTNEAKPAGLSPQAPLRETIRPFQATNSQSLRTIAPEPEDFDLDDEDEDDEDEQLANLEPAKPKGTGPLPRPESPWAKGANPSGMPPTSSSPPSPNMPSTNGGTGSLAERRERLNAIRTGQLSPTTPTVPGALDNEKPAASVTPAAAPPPANVGAPSRPPMSQSAYPSDEIRPKPTINIAKDDEKAKLTPAEATIANATPLTPPAAPSPVFKKPDTPPIATVSSGMPMRRARKNWKLPDYKTLLNTGSETDMDREQLLTRARTIEETLQSFGAPGRVVEVNTGPVITQFGVEPDYLVMRSGKKNRVKVGAIAQLDKDLQLALGAKSIRIEAPVPGKGFVGIEVPNDEASVVSLRDVMDSDAFKKIRAKSPLAIALGQSVDGAPIAADLGSMPHVLIAGTTGSGKSVLVNAIIAGLILNNTPDTVKFIMVDPKRVELTGYNGIPHLVAPVVVDLERIVGVLKWVTREMDERYKQFSNAGARNIEDFNKHLPPEQEQMPYIVVIIDELADLMMLAPDETERVITRIAALARATGIHLVIATQRPSVDVVTGLIKANFPARIAFAVAGGVDSRVILDQPGAEKLLGKGDMLYLSGDSPSALRLQGVYLSDTEINNITRYWKSFTAEDEPARPITALVLDDEDNEKPRDVMPRAMSPIAQQAFWDDSPKSINGNLVSDDDDDEDLGDGQDELYDQAVEMVRRLNKASVSLLQRRLRIGYTRAARLIDMMEEQGIVGPAQEGSKPREVLPMKG